MKNFIKVWEDLYDLMKSDILRTMRTHTQTHTHSSLSLFDGIQNTKFGPREQLEKMYCLPFIVREGAIGMK